MANCNSQSLTDNYYRVHSRPGTASSSRRSSCRGRGGGGGGQERWREGEQLEEKLERMMNYNNTGRVETSHWSRSIEILCYD